MVSSGSCMVVWGLSGPEIGRDRVIVPGLQRNSIPKMEILASIVAVQVQTPTSSGAPTRETQPKKAPGPRFRGVRAFSVGGMDGKPDSVGGRSHVQPFLWDGRCRPPQARDPLQDPWTRAPAETADRSCLRLHAMGFAVPFPSPGRRCALTAPFHPYHARPRAPFGGLLSVALSRVRAHAHGWPLATIESNRVRTFLCGTQGFRSGCMSTEAS